MSEKTMEQCRFCNKAVFVIAGILTELDEQTPHVCPGLKKHWQTTEDFAWR